MEPKKAQKQHDTFCSRIISGFFWLMLGQLHSKGMHDLTAMGKLKATSEAGYASCKQRCKCNTTGSTKFFGVSM